MKKLIILAAAAVGLAACAQKAEDLTGKIVTGTNPIINNQFTADPTARVFDGKLYLYPSHDIPSLITNNGQPWFTMEDYHVFSSEDLTVWTDHGVILSQEDVPWGKPDAYSMWAPDCVERNGKYYFYFPDAPKEGFGFTIGVAISDTPYGPFVPQPEPIKGVSGIDPCVLLASDGNAYLFWGAGRCAKLKDNMIELADDNPKEVMKWGDREFEMIGVSCLKGLPSRQAEGPFAFEYNGNFYLTYPYVREDTEVLAYARSKKPMGLYEYKGIIMAESPTGCWTNHHSIVNYQGEWYLFYHHNDYSPDFDKNRSARIDRLYFNEDGTIQEVIPTLRGVGHILASRNVEIDRYSSISGAYIEYLDPEDTFKGWKTVFEKSGDEVCFNEVDFGKKAPKNVVIRVKNDKDAKVGLTLGETAVLDIPASAEWTEVKLPMPVKVKGMQNLIVKLRSEGKVEIDWVKFI